MALSPLRVGQSATARPPTKMAPYRWRPGQQAGDAGVGVGPDQVIVFPFTLCYVVRPWYWDKVILAVR